MRPLRPPEIIDFPMVCTGFDRRAKGIAQGAILGMTFACKHRIVEIVVSLRLFYRFRETIRLFLFLPGPTLPKYSFYKVFEVVFISAMIVFIFAKSLHIGRPT